MRQVFIQNYCYCTVHSNIDMWDSRKLFIQNISFKCPCIIYMFEKYKKEMFSIQHNLTLIWIETHHEVIL